MTYSLTRTVLALAALLGATSAAAMSRPPEQPPTRANGAHNGRGHGEPLRGRPSHGGTGSVSAPAVTDYPASSSAPPSGGMSDSPASVPEPGMLGLFALGALGIAAGRRLSRRN